MRLTSSVLSRSSCKRLAASERKIAHVQTNSKNHGNFCQYRLSSPTFSILYRNRNPFRAYTVELETETYDFFQKRLCYLNAVTQP
ncbi:unnamed protein product [Victoria cruziana]